MNEKSEIDPTLRQETNIAYAETENVVLRTENIFNQHKDIITEQQEQTDYEKAENKSFAGQHGKFDSSSIKNVNEPNEALLWDTYVDALEKDPQCYYRALEAYKENLEDESKEIPPEDPNAVVDRRTPFTYISKPKQSKPTADPALRNNPLRGRLIILFATSLALLLIFLQTLAYNVYRFNRAYAPFSENSMLGPDGLSLYELGGLNTNAIRNNGDTYRLFWAAWMHSGWFHLLFNVLCQMQFFFMFEPDWGFWRTFLTFFISGIFGNLLSSVADPCTTTVGSSGGLFGLMGAMIAYCVEFWRTIPRPGCIIIFSVIVIIISIIVGFTGKTDNWAHMGGLLAGLLFSFATITALTAFEKQKPSAPLTTATNRPLLEPVISSKGVKSGLQSPKRRKTMHRSHIARKLQQKTYPNCRCGTREWAVRIGCMLVLIGLCILLFVLLFNNYEMQPVGHVSFYDSTRCTCCYLNLQGSQNPKKDSVSWLCFHENAIPENWGITWGKFCSLSLSEIAAITPPLSDIDPIGRRKR